MESPAVIEEFFAVIRSEREDTVIPDTHAPKCANQASHLFIHPANARVVKAHDLVARFSALRGASS